jgi:hypothetical protein
LQFAINAETTYPTQLPETASTHSVIQSLHDAHVRAATSLRMRLSVRVHSWAKVVSAVLCNFRLCAPLDRRPCAHARSNCLRHRRRHPRQHRRQHRHHYALDSHALYRHYPNSIVVIELVCVRPAESNAFYKGRVDRLFVIPTAATLARLVTVLPVVALTKEAVLTTYHAMHRRRPRLLPSPRHVVHARSSPTLQLRSHRRANSRNQ